MPVVVLYHSTLAANNIEKASRFLSDTLGLTDGYTPKVDFPVAWFYCGDQPGGYVVGEVSSGLTSGSRIDHIAFNCPDCPCEKARLDQKRANQTEQSQPDLSAHQILAKNP